MTAAIVLPIPPRPETKKDKLLAFEGIRGLASLAVLLGHLVIAFWPVLYSPGHPWMAKYPRIVQWLTESPTRVMMDGQFAVTLFFLLSGFVLSIGFFRNPSSEAIASAATRRLPRLMIPAAVSILIAYFVMKNGWMYNLWAAAYMDLTLEIKPHVWLTYFYDFRPRFATAAREAVWDTFFMGNNLYNKNLWTMSIELAGSFVVYAFLSLFGTLRRREVFYLVLGTFFGLTGRFHMLDFLLGLTLADYYARNERLGRPFRLPSLVGVALAVSALYFLSWKGQDSIAFWFAKIESRVLYETACGLALVVGVAFSPALQWFFSRGFFVFLGKISFSLYLLHLIVLCSLGCYVYLQLRTRFGLSHHLAAAAGSAACLSVSIGAAYLMTVVVDQPATRLGSMMYKRFFRNEAINAPTAHPSTSIRKAA